MKQVAKMFKKQITTLFNYKGNKIQYDFDTNETEEFEEVVRIIQKISVSPSAEAAKKFI